MPEKALMCGIDAALAVLGGKWKPLIVFHLAHEARRYGALRRCLPQVSDKVLIQHLKELEADGVVERTDHKEIPPRVDYSLSDFGMTLALSLAPLCAWGEAHAERITDLVSRKHPTPPTRKALDHGTLRP